MWDCCSKSVPCREGGGDCDNDNECAGHSVCGNNNCRRDFGYNWGSDADCCTSKKCSSQSYKIKKLYIEISLIAT